MPGIRFCSSSLLPFLPHKILSLRLQQMYNTFPKSDYIWQSFSNLPEDNHLECLSKHRFLELTQTYWVRSFRGKGLVICLSESPGVLILKEVWGPIQYPCGGDHQLSPPAPLCIHSARTGAERTAKPRLLASCHVTMCSLRKCEWKWYLLFQGQGF